VANIDLDDDGGFFPIPKKQKTERGSVVCYYYGTRAFVNGKQS
jgi:hypothetical protein